MAKIVKEPFFYLKTKRLHKPTKYNIMDNQQETNNYNLIKAIGLSVLMIIMLFSFFTKKDDATIFGIPTNPIQKTDSTTVQ
ncbi:MAG: hypothetical protein ACI976_001335 [Aureispira sp.]